LTQEVASEQAGEAYPSISLPQGSKFVKAHTEVKMRGLVLGAVVTVFVASTAWGQSVSSPPMPPPCGLKGLPDNALCFDLKTGKFLHTNQPPFIPSTPLPELPPTDNKPTTIQPYKVAPSIPTTSPPKIESIRSAPKETAPTPVVQPDTNPNREGLSDAGIQQEKQEEYAAGEVLGNAIGGVIYAARLRHTINKACFDRGAKGWRLPNGRTISCQNWEVLHPRQEHVIPHDLSVDQEALNRLCQQDKSFIYGTRIYSCKDWRAHERGGDDGKKIAEPKSPVGSNFFLAVMENARLSLSANPEDGQTRAAWSMANEQYCQGEPDALYRDLSGKVQFCGGTAGQTHRMMEELRQDVVTAKQDIAQNPAGTGLEKAALAAAESSWHDMKKIYCSKVSEGEYTGLGGERQSCSGRN
jgi:hypothetical protein